MKVDRITATLQAEEAHETTTEAEEMSWSSVAQAVPQERIADVRLQDHGELLLLSDVIAKTLGGLDFVEGIFLRRLPRCAFSIWTIVKSESPASEQRLLQEERGIIQRLSVDIDFRHSTARFTPEGDPQFRRVFPAA